MNEEIIHNDHVNKFAFIESFQYFCNENKLKFEIEKRKCRKIEKLKYNKYSLAAVLTSNTAKFRGTNAIRPIGCVHLFLERFLAVPVQKQ